MIEVVPVKDGIKIVVTRKGIPDEMFLDMGEYLELIDAMCAMQDEVEKEWAIEKEWVDINES